VFGLAQLEYVALQRWEEVAEILCGLWLIASPYIFGYADDGMLRYWHASLGGLVVLLVRFAAVAGLGPERSGHAQARAMTNNGGVQPAVSRQAGGFFAWMLNSAFLRSQRSKDRGWRRSKT
jgi:hypothetical protein